MAPHGNHTTCALIMSVLLLVSPAAAAQTAAIDNITVSNTNDDLLLYASLQGAFTERIKQAVLSGATTSVVFIILLKQGRFLWFDDTIADINVVHSIAYDKAKKEFVVRRSWRNRPTTRPKKNSWCGAPGGTASWRSPRPSRRPRCW